LWLPNCTGFVEHKNHHFAQARSNKEEHGYGEIDPVIVKKLSTHEKLAEQMKQRQIGCEALPLGSHPIERKQYYSQTFSMSPKFVTNKGLVRIKGKNIDFMQLLQRN
jgi:N-dimethylarginine dimethylaminohydrolase